MPRAVVITGMHRSGTSLAASLLGRAGVEIGDRLLDASRANPRGFFEDIDFVEFHQRILKDRGRTILVDESFTFEPTAAESERADELVAQRSGKVLWGWKDPRTSLFLDFWDLRIDDARYLFLFRHPLDVLLSLLRRGDADALGVTEGIQAWETYNRRILEFRARHPERCTLIHAHGLSVVDALNDALHSKLRLEIAVTPEILDELYRPDELHRTDKWARTSFALLEPTAADLYDELDRAADVNAPEGPQAADEPSDLATFGELAAGLLPGLRSHRRGLLLTLLEIVSPDDVESAVTLRQRWIGELEGAKEWLDEQRLGWMQRAEALEHRPVRTLLTQLGHRLLKRA